MRLTIEQEKGLGCKVARVADVRGDGVAEGGVHEDEVAVEFAQMDEDLVVGVILDLGVAELVNLVADLLDQFLALLDHAALVGLATHTGQRVAHQIVDLEYLERGEFAFAQVVGGRTVVADVHIDESVVDGLELLGGCGDDAAAWWHVHVHHLIKPGRGNGDGHNGMHGYCRCCSCRYGGDNELVTLHHRCANTDLRFLNVRACMRRIGKNKPVSELTIFNG